MKLLQEFKEFAVKGNMMDMAIGIIIGAAFNKVLDVTGQKDTVTTTLFTFQRHQHGG